MLWWFLILGGSAAVIFWASTALYLRVRRHMKSSHDGSKTTDEAESHRQQGAGKL
jgi:hypothetical protein